MCFGHAHLMLLFLAPPPLRCISYFHVCLFLNLDPTRELSCLSGWFSSLHMILSCSTYFFFSNYNTESIFMAKFHKTCYCV